MSADMEEPGSSRYEPIAVVGTALRLPGGIGSLEQLTSALAAGKDLVGPMPQRRWDTGAWYDPQGGPGKSYQNEGSFLDDVDVFEPEAFGISPREVRAMDPQQRLMLQLCWELLESAGVQARELRGYDVGTFIGMLANDYMSLKHAADGAIGPYHASGVEHSFMSGRLAYQFGFAGPAMTVSTACSSSLAAVHLGCAAIRAGECTLAVAGGVSLILDSELSVYLAQIGALSRSNRCHTFDESADGIVRGEGAGLVLLKAADAALRDGDPILAVIRGSAMTHAGSSTGLTVPSTDGQTEAMRSALKRANIDASSVSYIEAHGTGTPLGDPIELQSIQQGYGADAELHVGSHKANFGHLDAAAGITGLLKTICTVRAGSVFPQINFASPTSFFDWENSGLQVPTELATIGEQGDQLIGAVSAFGLSGSNVHVVVEGNVAAEPGSDCQDLHHASVPLLVGAHSADAVRRRCAQLGSLSATQRKQLVDHGLAIAGQYRHRACIDPTTGKPVSDPVSFPELAGSVELLAGGTRPADHWWSSENVLAEQLTTAALAHRLVEGPDDSITPRELALALCRRLALNVVDGTEDPLEAPRVTAAVDDATTETCPALAVALDRLVDQSHGIDEFVGRLLGALHVGGADGRFQLLAERDATVQVPTYPWAGEHYWFEDLTDESPEAASGQRSDAEVATEATGEDVAGFEVDVDLTDRARTDAPVVDPSELRAWLDDELRRLLESEKAVPQRQALFELGLDSIMAAELASAISAHLNADFRAHDILDAETPLGVLAMMQAVVAERPVTSPQGNVAASAGPPDGTAAGPSDVAPPCALSERKAELQNSFIAEPSTTISTTKADVAVSGDDAADLTSEVSVLLSGIGCRLPGAVRSPDELWGALLQGSDFVSDVPPPRLERWRLDGSLPTEHPSLEVPGVFRGGYLDDIDGFDNRFFRISGREARDIDPQQRFILEVAWEAIEDAGIDPFALADERVGVYVGLNSNDYAQILARDPDRLTMAFGTGVSPASSAGRISYFLGLNGPASTVDTACSSGLVAISNAVDDLRTGRIDKAIVAAANIMATPTVNLVAAEGGALAADGRCKAFSDDADGYGRGEGVIAVLLEAAGEGSAGNQRAYAAISGVGINQDGAGTGFTVPNRKAQVDVINLALADAGFDGSSVEYLEAHGTGTPLGDPIEVEAAAAAYRSGGESKLLIGTAKSNFGHLEAAAGLLGLAKAALSLDRATITPSLHAEHLSTQIRWDKCKLTVPSNPIVWNSPVRRAGVSAFGFTGTNAHIVLESVEPAAAELAPPGPLTLGLAAHSVESMKARVEKIATTLDQRPEVTTAFCSNRTLDTSLPYRLLITGADAKGLRSAVASYLDDDSSSDIRVWDVPEQAERTVAVFSGYGSQWPGMARELYERDSEFARYLDRVSATIEAVCGFDVVAAIADGAGGSGSERQETIFAIQVALFDYFGAKGVEFDAVVGHSMGEVAAAYAAGCLDLTDASTVMVERCRTLQKIVGKGAMAIVGLPAERVAKRLAEDGETHVEIAVVNSPVLTVVSGSSDGIERYVQLFRDEGLFAKQLNADGAGHSHLLDPYLDDLRHSLQVIRPQAETLPLISTVTAAQVSGTVLNSGYWSDNLRCPVRFSEAIARVADGATTFVEFGPHPMLLQAIEQSVEMVDEATAIGVATLMRDGASSASLDPCFASLRTIGHTTNWHPASAVHAPVRLPGYEWEHRAFWPEPTAARAGVVRVGGRPTESTELPNGTTFHITRLTAEAQQSVCQADIETWLAACVATSDASPLTMEDVAVDVPLVLGSGPLSLVAQIDARAGRLSLSSTIDGAPRSEQRHLSGSVVVGIGSATTSAEADDAASRPLGDLGTWVSTSDEQTRYTAMEWLPLDQTSLEAGPDNAESKSIDVVIDLTSEDLVDSLVEAWQAVAEAREGQQTVRLVSVGESASTLSPVAALARILAIEDPKGFGGFVGVTSTGRNDALSLLASLEIPSDEQVLVDTDGVASVARLVSVDGPSVGRSNSSVGQNSVGHTATPNLGPIVSADAGVDDAPALAISDVGVDVLRKHLQRAVLAADRLVDHIPTTARVATMVSPATIVGAQGGVVRSMAEALFDARLSQNGYRNRVAVGLATNTTDLDQATLTRGSGIPLLEADAAEELVAAAASTDSAKVIPNIDWSLFSDWYRATPLAAALTQTDDRPQGTLELVEQLRRAQPAQRIDRVMSELATLVGEVVGEDARDLSNDAGFFELGMTSIMAVELRTSVASTFGVVLGATSAFAYPNIRSLASHLCDELELSHDGPETSDADGEPSGDLPTTDETQPSTRTEDLLLRARKLLQTTR